MNVALRPCTMNDADLLLRWRNDPAIIAHSTRKVSVNREEHMAWLKDCLSSPDTHRIFLIQADGEEMGVLRYDQTVEEAADVSIYLSPGREGDGIGVTALIDGSLAVFRAWPYLQRIDAYVLETNQRAAFAFVRAGYVDAEPILHGHLRFCDFRQSVSS